MITTLAELLDCTMPNELRDALPALESDCGVLLAADETIDGETIDSAAYRLTKVYEDGGEEAVCAGGLRDCMEALAETITDDCPNVHYRIDPTN